jgi:hypothetical protein
MERWLKTSAAVEAAPVEPQKAADRATAVKAEMAKVWDATATREDMLKHIESWLAYGGAPAEVRGCMLREELQPLLVEVYQEKHPEDFAAKAEEPVEGAGPYRTPGELEEPV